MYLVHSVDSDNKKVGNIIKLCSTVDIARDTILNCIEKRYYRTAIFHIEVDVENSETFFEVYQVEDGLVHKSLESDKEIGYLSTHSGIDFCILNTAVKEAVEDFLEFANTVSEEFSDYELVQRVNEALVGKDFNCFYSELRDCEKRYIVELHKKMEH